MRLLLIALAAAAACDTKPTMPGDPCATTDEMKCGQASGGTTVALLCMPGVANGSSWSYVTNCSSCDHVTGCKTELICNGTNIANEGLRCEVEGVGACSTSNSTHLLKCMNLIWTLSFDCSTLGMTCGKVPDGNLSCT